MATKKKEPSTLTSEEKFYKLFSQMAKVNFLGYILRDYFKERLIGKDDGSIEVAKLKAIIRILEEKFMDQIE
jgi:hypothetical protein